MSVATASAHARVSLSFIGRGFSERIPPRERGSGVHYHRTPRAFWLAVVLVVILLSYVVPFAVLWGVDAWYGSMLFWILGTVVVIAVNAVVSSAWRD